MSRFVRLLTSACALVTVLSILFATAALAHERRTIGGGKYDVVVGWDKEPAFVNQQNAASIRIFKSGTEDPVQGVEKTLKVRIAFGGGEPKEFPLRAVFGQEGYYVADLFPTRAGAYIWTFVGDIEGTAINDRFESGPGRFNDVAPLQDLQFPETVPPPADLAQQTQAANALAQSALQRATLLGLGGIGMGLVGVVLAVVALVMRGGLRSTLQD